MSVPSGWLPSPSGSGSAQGTALLPVPATGTYIEPPGATPGPPVAPLSVSSFVNGGGSVVGSSDGGASSLVTFSRTSVYGALLLDSVVTEDAGGPEQCPRPPLTSIVACPRLPEPPVIPI